MNREDVIKLALKAGWGAHTADLYAVPLERFAVLAIAAQQKRADALAETINALRDIVTFDYESKEQFIHRVRELLSACPDTRVLQAVLDEREACAQVCDNLDDDLPDGLAGWQFGEAIRARGEK